MSTSSIEETRQPKGALLFTGPDGARDLKVKVLEGRFVGHGSSSPEASGDTQYLMRGAAVNPHPLSKSSKVGEIGWGVPKLSDYSLLKTGNQITLATFRQRAEDRHTHLYQEPYYPPPDKALRIGKTPQNLSETSTEDSEHKLHIVS